MWTILEEVKHNQRIQYRVQCDCGAIEIRRIDHVKSGRTTCCRSCSAQDTYAIHGKNNPVLGKKGVHKGVGDINRAFYLHYRYGAEKRNIVFDVSIEYLWELFLRQNKKCALSGVDITISSNIVNSNVDYANTTASLDRKNSSLGYTEDNVQWVHKTINYIKRDLTDEDFIRWCSHVHANHDPSLV